MTNRHTYYDLKQMQSVPLEGKIIMTKERIRQWYEHWDGNVYVSFSGGKDSTVLKHIVDSMYDDVPSVFVNTGLEYPEIQQFVKRVKNGEFDCFNSDVEILRPEMRFDEVIQKYGYPVVSKEVSERIYYAKRGSDWALKCMNGLNPDGTESTFKKSISKWKYLLESPFDVSHKCCTIMKKNPAKLYEKETGNKPMIGTMAYESSFRKHLWMKTGCNAFISKRPLSAPMSFWTKQDVLRYIKEFNVPYCSIYGDIVLKQVPDGDSVLDGQINLIDCVQCYGTEYNLMTTGLNGTGCIFCMFGCHLEKEPNRFQRLKKTHPKQYDFCINGGEYNEEGKWQPNKEGLGLGKVLDYIGVKYD